MPEVESTAIERRAQAAARFDYHAGHNSHLKSFRVVLLSTGNQLEVTFRARTGAKGQSYPETTYRYGSLWIDDLEKLMGVYEAMKAAVGNAPGNGPGKVLHSMVIAAGDRGRRI